MPIASCRCPRSGGASAVTPSAMSSGSTGRIGCTTAWCTPRKGTAGRSPGWLRSIRAMTHAVVLISAERDALNVLGSRLAGVEGVSEAWSVTGEWDFVAVIRTEQQDQMADVITSKLARLPGIVKTYTMVAFEVFSQHDLDAMFSIGAQVSADYDHPIQLTSEEDDLSRSRLTVFFRLLLALPHIVWFSFWTLLVFVVAILNWFVTLFNGRPPDGFNRLLTAYVRYTAHLGAYVSLTCDLFPDFVGKPGSYPVDVHLPEEPQL